MRVVAVFGAGDEDAFDGAVVRITDLEGLFGESGCDITSYRRFRHVDPMVVAQPLRDRGDRDGDRQLLGDPVVVHRNQRPCHRSCCRVVEFGEPAAYSFAPHRFVERDVGRRCQTLG